MIAVTYRFPSDPEDRPDQEDRCQHREELEPLIAEVKAAGGIMIQWREMGWRELLAEAENPEL